MSVPILYKYHSYNKYLFELINSNSFYVAQLSELNDVFDCKFEFTKDWFKKGFQSRMPGLTTNGRGRSLIDQAINDPEFLDEFYSTASVKKFTTTGVCSFTTDHMNELLWAYYTNYYGVCLKFDFTNDDPIRNHFHKVEYDDRMPQVTDENDMMKAGRTKKKIFQFEKEYRILYLVGKDKAPFNKSSLKAIYYGSRLSESEIEKLQKIIREKEYMLESFQMEMKPYKNHFSFHRIDER